LQQEKDGWSDEGSSAPAPNSGPSLTDSHWSTSKANNHDDFFASMGGTNKVTSKKMVDDWNNQEWNPVETETGESGSGGGGEDLKRRREERKLQRQRELEAKRGNKAGPMKLGAKKNLDI